MARLFIIGKSQRVTPGDILGAVAGGIRYSWTSGRKY